MSKDFSFRNGTHGFQILVKPYPGPNGIRYRCIGDEGAVAMKDANKPVLLQLCQGTPGRHAVDRKLFGNLMT